MGENVANKVSGYTTSGGMVWSFDRAVNAADISASGYAYVLTSSGTIYGDTLLVIDPTQGTILD